MFIGDPNADTITLSSLKKISKELGENMSDEELKIMLERASKNGVEHLLYKVITIKWTFQKSFKIVILEIITICNIPVFDQF